jgi:hypothetical protein
MAIGTSASLLGLHEFSLLSRVQSGQIEINRARSGEVLIPIAELERLADGPVNHGAIQENPRSLSDEHLGIERRYGGLRRNGESASFRVPHYQGSFTQREIESYRTAFGAIAMELAKTKELKEQLDHIGERYLSGETQSTSPEIGQWAIRSRLLNLEGGDVLLCERNAEFAIIERFRPESRYAQAHGRTEILLQGDDPDKLLENFKTDAHLTLEFLASNLVAKAQRIVWEQFPDERPGHIVTAISERCRQAVNPQETLVENVGQKNTWNRGVRI